MEQHIDLVALGARIKKARKWMPQAALAREIGVSRASICEWEKGTARPSIDSIVALASALGVSVDALLRPDAAEEKSA